MVHPQKIFGRLGNSLFQYATLYAKSRDEGTDFYFQDPKHFQKYEREIREMFGEGISTIPYVSIHIRRGGNPINNKEPKYCENPFYVDLAKDTDGKFPEYYAKAIAMFPNDKFLVFSDEPAFARSLFSNIYDADRFKILEKGNELEDFNAMASCKHNIIANSSYSWWAAYLNLHVGKKIIAPSKERWYSDGIERTVCPSDWIRI